MHFVKEADDAEGDEDNEDGGLRREYYLLDILSTSIIIVTL
jgi:hypothetical protein